VIYFNQELTKQPCTIHKRNYETTID